MANPSAVGTLTGAVLQEYDFATDTFVEGFGWCIDNYAFNEPISF